MRKDILIKYFKGEASGEELDLIIDWVNKSESNRLCFAREKELWVLANFVDENPDISIFEKILDKAIPKKENVNKGTKKWFPVIYFSVAATIIVLLITNIAINLFKEQDPVKKSNNVGQSGVTASVEKDDINSKQKAPAISNQLYSLYTNKGIKASLTLPDGSRVWLNSDSKIIYPKEFSGKYREVKIEGEAYFEIVYIPQSPMIIKTNRNFRITVLGTTLSVRSYSNETNAQTSLYSGVIKLNFESNQKNTDTKELIINPNETCIVNNDCSKISIVKERDIKKNIAWKNGELLFDNTPMEEVLKILERWHGTKFTVNNTECYKYSLTASFGSESVIQIMEIVKLCIPIQYKAENNKIEIY